MAIKGYRGLIPRGGTYSVKVRVPADLTPFYRGEHVVKALRASSLAEAKRLHPQKVAEIEDGFEELRSRLNGQDRVRLALQSGRLEFLRDRDVAALVHDWISQRDLPLAPVDSAEAAVQRGEFSDLERRLLHPEPYEADPAQHMADRLLVKAGVPTRVLGRLQKASTVAPVVDHSTEQYRYLVGLVRKALAGETQQALIAAGGAPRFDVTDPLASATMSVNDLIDSYSAARSEAYGEESTKRKRSLGFRALREVIDGRSAASAVTDQHAQAVARLIAQTPSNATKKLGKITVREAAASAAVKGLPLVAPATIAGHIQGLRAMFSWAEDQGEWGITRNPFRRVKSVRAPQVKREKFSPEQLQDLFHALAAFRKKRPSRFWVPALALYTGARMNEICQLYTLDVIGVEGVSCLNLSEFGADGRRVPDKRVKNSTSERIVPLHKALIDAGFLAFVATRRGSDRLFPDLQLGPDGRYSHGFSKWFGAFKKSFDFDKPSLVFHSFRHGFRDACRRAEIGDEAGNALGGWTHINQGSRYGERGMVPELNRAIQKLSFGEFVLPKNKT